MKFECIDAKQEFDDILKLFSATDIKFTDESIDEDGIYYVANILMNDDSESKIKSLISDNAAEFIDNGEYMFNTKYGYCDISDDGDQYTIECFVPIECCEQIDECVDDNYIPITEADDGEEDILPIYEMSITVNSDSFYIEIKDNKDYYDLYIDENLFIQEPKTESNRDWELRDFSLLAFDTFADYYKEVYFGIHD